MTKKEIVALLEKGEKENAELWYFMGRDKDGPAWIISLPVGEWPKMYHDGGLCVFRTRPYPTEDQLRAECNIIDAQCHECGGVVALNYAEPLRSRMAARGLCFTCDFWSELIGAGRLVIDGEAYAIGDERHDGGMRGFGGCRFTIEKADGSVIVSTNLWTSGRVPAHFRDRMPDNARFVSL